MFPCFPSWIRQKSLAIRSFDTVTLHWWLEISDSWSALRATSLTADIISTKPSPRPTATDSFWKERYEMISSTNGSRSGLILRIPPKLLRSSSWGHFRGKRNNADHAGSLFGISFTWMNQMVWTFVKWMIGSRCIKSAREKEKEEGKFSQIRSTRSDGWLLKEQIIPTSSETEIGESSRKRPKSSIALPRNASRIISTDVILSVSSSRPTLIDFKFAHSPTMFQKSPAVLVFSNFKCRKVKSFNWLFNTFSRIVICAVSSTEKYPFIFNASRFRNDNAP